MMYEQHKRDAFGNIARGSFWKKFGSLFGAGLTGVAALAPALAPVVTRQLATNPRIPRLPVPVLTTLSLIQPTVLLAGAIAAGVALAPRLRLRSHIAEVAAEGKALLPALRPELPLAVAAGIGTGVALTALDILFRPWMPESFEALARTQTRGLEATLAGLLYGGITEELMMRWGLMTTLAWGAWRLAQQEQELPRQSIMWAALGTSALLFGVGHLGAAAALTPLTPALVARTVLLNSAGGIVFGWLYWRRSLEAAMIAHATVHVVFSLVAWLGSPV